MNNIDIRLMLLLISSEATVQQMTGSEKVDFQKVITSVEEVLDMPISDFYEEIIETFSSIEAGKSEQYWLDTTQDLILYIKDKYKNNK